jgi:hypothetical protein
LEKMMPSNLLTKLSIRNTDLAKDTHGNDVLHVRDPHALIQASGYLKFIRAKEGEAIFYGATAPGKPKETLVADLPQVKESKARERDALRDALLARLRALGGK